MNGAQTEVAVIKGETVEKTVYKCPKCGAAYETESGAENCFGMYLFLALINRIYTAEGGGFLLKGEEVIAVRGITTVPRECCGDSYVDITLVSSNNRHHINRHDVRRWLDAGVINISLTEAVERGWRAAFRDIWEARATPEMVAEYRAAIGKVIDRLTPERKQELLEEALMFPRKANGKPILE